MLRVRGRATVAFILLGLPLLVAYAIAHAVPDVMWFDELGQSEMFRRVLTAKAELFLVIAFVVAVFVGANLAIAAALADIPRTRARGLAIAVVALLTGSTFAATAGDHWLTFLLWRHRQDFGVVDPIHGKDVGYFVFTLPLELFVSALLLWLVAVTACSAALLYWAKAALRFRPPHASFECQAHLAGLTAIFLLVVAWRLRLAQYTLELRQPSGDGRSFAGANFTDVQVVSPGYGALAVLALVLVVLCLAGPLIARAKLPRRMSWVVAAPAALMALGLVLVQTWVPAVVQHYAVDPNPLLSQQPYLERSIEATRVGLGLDRIDLSPYAPTGTFTAADFAPASERLANVAVWDTWLLEARMRELVSETPYYSPEAPILDVTDVDGRPRPTIVSARELDLERVHELDASWISDRLSYTHGLGLVRFSGTDIGENREPRLLASSLGPREPRIYFGNLQAGPVGAAEGDDDDEEDDDDDGPEAAEAGGTTATTTNGAITESSWVLVNTRRPEIDIPTDPGLTQQAYHYDGTGGIALSNWARRAAFAIALGSKDLLLSDDVTDETRILLHRDVHERLQTLAPFIHWDTRAIPLATSDRIVFVVDGYATTSNYPYAERVDLAGSLVNYARASVRATVDAFSGDVDLYVTDDAEPITQAWAEAFPTLFESVDEMPAELKDRLRYPQDLFATQAAAYERFHTTQPDLFVSNADVWSRPIALSGPIEVAGDVDFDESDEDDLRLTMEPGYAYAPPPGLTNPRLILSTSYVPRSSQNLVGTLTGWIDRSGQPRLGGLSMARDPVTLGPAQVSRVVFATPRVSNLLGLRNLEIRDLDASSLDTVLLGEPHMIFLPSGVIQIQSLYEGSRGPGAARLLGVTAFLNGRAGLGPDVASAVRQALNEPPQVHLQPIAEPVVVEQPAELAFDVENASREVVTITSPAGITTRRLRVETGRASMSWEPSTAGATQIRVRVVGLDGTIARDSLTVRVLGPPPTVRLIEVPDRAVVGRPLQVTFRVANARSEVARVSMRSGVVFLQRYLIHDGTGVIDWRPPEAGRAVLLVRATGPDGQVVDRRLTIDVAPRETSPAAPSVTLIRIPQSPPVGQPASIVFRADACDAATARIQGPQGDIRLWRFPCPARRAIVRWTPTSAGQYQLTVIARAGETTAQATTPIIAVEPR